MRIYRIQTGKLKRGISITNRNKSFKKCRTLRRKKSKEMELMILKCKSVGKLVDLLASPEC